MTAVHPDIGRFTQYYESGMPQLVWLDLIADTETPVTAYLKLAQSQPYSFVLESIEDGDVCGRYSIIGLNPDLIFRVCDGKAFMMDMKAGDDDFKLLNLDPLDGLRMVLERSHIEMSDDLPMMSAGVFGYLSYDMVRHMEDLPDSNSDVMGTPDCQLIRPELIAVFDNITRHIKLVTPVRPDDEMDAQTAYDRALARLTVASDKMAANMPDEHIKTWSQSVSDPISNMSRDDYFNMVNEAKSYIEAGDIFQVVLSQRFSMPFPLPPFDLYRALRRVNPSPYLFFLQFDDFTVVGSSPEVLVGVRDRIVNIRPIAGTRKRGHNAQEDKEITDDLLSDEKERAEHLMLLDLGRNDVGRVSKIGSLQVNRAFDTQMTSHLIHIVSDVTGELLPDYDELDALIAGFPAGTVSGAPKIRAMEIIDELEPDRRGIYAGCVGYFSSGGDMDSCIALRTGIIKDGTLYVQAGGGVVHDSTPQYEYDETVNKAAALFKAARTAIDLAREQSEE